VPAPRLACNLSVAPVHELVVEHEAFALMHHPVTGS